MRYIDIRSDTVTQPTQAMREAMYSAEVGDDVYGEDPTVNRLEEMAAEIMGKEAAIFVTSGTQGNQTAVLTHTNRGDEIILEETAHIFTHEVAGTAFLSGVQVKSIKGHNGMMEVGDIEKAIRPENIHYPKTALICLENTHNRAGGTVTPLERMKNIYEMAHRHGIPIHLDGARIFNAAIYLGVPAREIAQYADSVQFCLSKGLCAPVGSLLVGTKDFIKRARKYRKMLGGGLRQSGFLAAAGIVALTEMVDRLAEDHENARILADGLANIKGININMETVQTNIIVFSIEGLGINGDRFVSMLYDRGIKANGSPDYGMRFVTHKDVQREDVYTVLKAVQDISHELVGI
ncbi:MAG: low-specificity L-threonine aldolase [Thermoanaerobacteraceae bacterium]|nr:low-specificity L-threonine aldolase [Thermoanaerobacteraceae bacterium]